jgi:hypothetical protein
MLLGVHQRTTCRTLLGHWKAGSAFTLFIHKNPFYSCFPLPGGAFFTFLSLQEGSQTHYNPVSHELEQGLHDLPKGPYLSTRLVYEVIAWENFIARIL